MRKVKLFIIDSSMFSPKDLSIVPLTAKEKEYVEKAFTSEKRKERVLSKYLKEKYVGSYYLDENKKPLSKDKYFNVSHSDEMIILGICDVDIGVDIEKIKDASSQMKRFIASDDEYEYMVDEERFFEIWTNKEALMKCVGIGITDKLKEIPALPINGVRVFEDELYISKTLRLNDYLISVCIKSDESFEVEQIKITTLEAF